MKATTSKMCEHNHTKEDWNNHYRKKVDEFENQIQMLKTIEHLQATQLELIKLIRKGIEKEITELKVLIDDEQGETSTSTRTQT